MCQNLKLTLGAVTKLSTRRRDFLCKNSQCKQTNRATTHWRNCLRHISKRASIVLLICLWKLYLKTFPDGKDQALTLLKTLFSPLPNHILCMGYVLQNVLCVKEDSVMGKDPRTQVNFHLQVGAKMRGWNVVNERLVLDWSLGAQKDIA